MINTVENFAAPQLTQSIHNHKTHRRHSNGTFDMKIWNIEVADWNNIANPMFGIVRKPWTEKFTVHTCGEMAQMWVHCQALHWIDERAFASHPQFSLSCNHNKIHLPLLDLPLPLLRHLLEDRSKAGNECRRNIVQYNHSLAYTSIGVKQDHSVNHGKRPPVFRIHGELMHFQGCLLPPENSPPSYAQFYMSFFVVACSLAFSSCLGPASSVLEAGCPCKGWMRLVDQVNVLILITWSFPNSFTFTIIHKSVYSISVSESSQPQNKTNVAT